MIDLSQARRDWHQRFDARARQAEPKGARVTIRNGAGGSAEILLYDEIGSYGVDAKTFAAQLAEITAPTITLRINSPGGDVFDGLAMYASLRSHPATISTVVDGLAASAASIVALAGTKVNMAENALLMIHKAWSIALGNADDFKSAAAVLDKIDGQLAAIYVAKSGKPLAQVQAAMAAETWYTADEAKNFGLIDAVIDDGQQASNSMRSVRMRLRVAEAETSDRPRDRRRTPAAANRDRRLRLAEQDI